MQEDLSAPCDYCHIPLVKADSCLDMSCHGWEDEYILSFFFLIFENSYDVTSVK